MYVTTFYSFKGGVGRTMALVNSAVELANRGRRVLAVDFDLEAPGLDSFGILRPEKPTPGLIDFVRQYLETEEAPDAAGFMYRVPRIGDEKGGELWIMPAGSARDDYGVRFRDVDWAELYDRYDGYLLFEDLKAQWEKNLGADWVFVDSRTGHTDTGGICTRQLPDAVVAVFFPNEQNLRGLTRVVREIRAEARTAREKRIKLHCVMSNVPDLDDEDAILGKQIKAFRKELALEHPPVTVHHYDSLALLNQAVFIQERPRSRLAGEYRHLVQALIHANEGDREGALSQVEDARRSVADLPRVHRNLTPSQTGVLREIEKRHRHDAEVLCRIAKVYRLLNTKAAPSAPVDATRLFEEAIAAGSREPEAFLYRGRSRMANGDVAGAKDDAMRVLGSDTAHFAHIQEAARMASISSKALLNTVAAQSLDELGRILLDADVLARGS